MVRILEDAAYLLMDLFVFVIKVAIGSTLLLVISVAGLGCFFVPLKYIYTNDVMCMPTVVNIKYALLFLAGVLLTWVVNRICMHALFR